MLVGGGAKTIVFRVDASIQMGTGHVMRCLTLADALKNEGAECYFICREHLGNLIGLIKERGHIVYALSYIDHSQKVVQSVVDNELSHASWLGSSQENDANLCIQTLESLRPDWLIIDHYALDSYWEKKLRPYCDHIMVIDDLADRYHDCDLLLDQTFGRDSEDYMPFVPEYCQLLCGASFALLRPEFAKWRGHSLKRRSNGQIEHLLINLGGVDKDNITTRILKSLALSPLAPSCSITVVMGTTAPWIKYVREQAETMPWDIDVKVGVNNMAELMANSDIAIGAAGATSWERCCLGLPTIMVVVAENQQTVANNLRESGAALFVNLNDISIFSMSKMVESLIELKDQVSFNAANVTSGVGADFLVKNILGSSHVRS